MELIWHILFAFQLNALFFTTDNLNNIYAAQDNFSLVKYDSAGTKLFSYQVKGAGEPTSIDASNPLKILVYYKNFSTIYFLDNTLSEIGNVNLSSIGILQPPVVCESSDGNFWVYDETDNRLKKFDTQLKVIAESQLLSDVSEKNIEPLMMVEENNQLYISDSSQGIFVFDRFGAFSNKISVKGVNKFQVLDDYILYQKGDSLFAYATKFLEEKFYMSLPENSKLTRIAPHRLYVMQEKQIVVYPF